MSQLPALELRGMAAGYQGRAVVQDITLQVMPGEWLTIIGPNGAGKSTLLKAISGTAAVYDGTILVDGTPTTGTAAHRMWEHRVVFVPQGGQVFDELTVEENIEIGGACLSAHELGQAMDRERTAFPMLQALWRRRAGSLSGGEKQLLAIARGLMSGPRLLLLDEPTAALAPALGESVLGVVDGLRRDRGVTIVSVEQRVQSALTHCDEVTVLRGGHIVDKGQAQRFVEDTSWRRFFVE